MRMEIWRWFSRTFKAPRDAEGNVVNVVGDQGRGTVAAYGRYWDGVGFDVVGFDRDIQVPEGVSCLDHIARIYSKWDADLIHEIVKMGRSMPRGNDTIELPENHPAAF